MLPDPENITKKWKKEWLANYKEIIRDMKKRHKQEERTYKTVLRRFETDLKELRSAKTID